MTLNGLNGHFTLYVHYYELPLTHYLLLIYCRLFIARDVTSGEVRETEYSKQWSAERQNIIRGKSAALPWTAWGRYIVGTFTNNANITPHTVVWECCKDDQQSQWEMPNFGVCQLRNPWGDFQKNLQGWLRRGPHPTCKYWDQSVQRGRVCACVKLSPPGVYFFSLFFRFHAPRYRSARWTDRRR